MRRILRTRFSLGKEKDRLVTGPSQVGLSVSFYGNVMPRSRFSSVIRSSSSMK